MLFPLKIGLTVSEAATAAGLSRWSILEAIRQGQLDALSVSDKLYFVPQSSLDRFLAARGQK